MCNCGTVLMISSTWQAALFLDTFQVRQSYINNISNIGEDINVCNLTRKKNIDYNSVFQSGRYWGGGSYWGAVCEQSSKSPRRKEMYLAEKACPFVVPWIVKKKKEKKKKKKEKKKKKKKKEGKEEEEKEEREGMQRR
ncbi:hypothetical protein HELRODRAFT_165126 [Helobdella robusta]|uniref:SRCR domain-containing protein n=1 Tax=Helobdella robusta TaxID=6412 RepID=T1EWB2_HELRO|nr:hypothetical protein HELRODRAFT_165126 [Helobdella robusta]ESN92980.1 hypothetical protein HELRODRAFT_165126 [Helobdella robusta]